jgi:hypothetical protein
VIIRPSDRACTLPSDDQPRRVPIPLSDCRTPCNPWDMFFPLCVACSAGSRVIRHSPTSPVRSRPPFVFERRPAEIERCSPQSVPFPPEGCPFQEEAAGVCGGRGALWDCSIPTGAVKKQINLRRLVAARPCAVVSNSAQSKHEARGPICNSSRSLQVFA